MVIPCCLSIPKCDVPGIPQPEHQCVFLWLWLYQQSPTGLLLAPTAVYLPRGNSLDATTTPLAAKLVSHGWPPKHLTSCRGVEDTFCRVQLRPCFSHWHQCFGFFSYTCSILWFPLHQEFAYFQIESVHSQRFVNRAKGKGMHRRQISASKWEGLLLDEGKC